MKAQSEIVDLMSQWEADPCWDIEDTMGFEEHYAELKAFGEKRKQQWAEERERDLLAKAEWLGVPGNTTLARHIEWLEHQIARLQERLDDRS